MEKLLVFILLLMCDFFIDANAIVTVTEVKAGHLAVLPCLSSDDNHRFMFWQLADDQGVIGPGNPLDQEKYNYEVLTGKLLIRVKTCLRIFTCFSNCLILKMAIM